GGNCGSTLAAASSCTIEVQFNPVSTGVSTDTINISYNDGTSTQISTRDIEATGVNPALLTIAGGTTYDYGSLSVASSATHTFTINNSGGATATALSETGLSAPFDYLGGSYPGTGGTCSTDLATGSNCTIVVEYSPIAATADSDTITLDYNDGNTVQVATIGLQGTGVNLALLTISESDPYDFGPTGVGTTTTHTFTLTNNGNTPATAVSGSGLSLPFKFEGNNYPGSSGTCSSTIGAGSSCTIVVEFSPVSTVFSTNTISIDYNDGSGAQVVTREVQGTGN
ncbi:MAG: choice-of-anchor D domain-containing protein, partial [Bdellovibrionales bacterium]|nr:choice-of-anchor D domain-containing protein [Bdellovibrionales bacterium]